MELTREQMNKAQILEKHIRETEQQGEFIGSQLSELELFHDSLSKFASSKETEILSSIGNGVYAKTQLLDKELFVEVGKGIVLKKNPEEVQEVLQGQIKKLSEAKVYIDNQLNFYMSSLKALIEEIESAKKDGKKE